MTRPAIPPLRLVWRLSAVGDLRDLPAGVAGALPHAHPGMLLLDLGAVAGPFDARDIDALARAALLARRRRWTLRVIDGPPALLGLLELSGLRSALLDA